MPGEDLATELNVVAIVANSSAIELMSRTLSLSGDRLSVATDLTEGLSRVSAQIPDVAFVDVTLGDGAGLAVLHHIRALAPTVAVYALTVGDRMDLGMQAQALGSTGTLVMPLSGDELLTAMSEVRTRLAERLERLRLERAARASRKSAAVVARVAEIAEARTRRDAAERLAQLFVTGACADAVVVYVPAAEGARELMRTALVGELSDSPTFCDEMELLNFARERGGIEVVRLALKREHSGIVLLSGLPPAGPELEEAMRVVNLIATQATTALALIGAREQSHRGSMKDPASSAYTFAYFVDVAGREIDMARRHGRRFALATVGIQYRIPRFDVEQAEPSVVAAERVLAAVRDTDVLARVDANEFYLLLPETGGLGAHACRRRVVSQLEAQNSTTTPGTALSVVVGVATFPHDGSDLSHLLRVAKFRADASQNSVVQEMGLNTMALADIADLLLAHLAGPPASGVDSLDLPHYIELPAVDLVAVALGAVSEAMRGGQTRVYTTHHAGISIGGAVRAELVRDGEGVRFDTVDVSTHAGCANLEILTIVAEHATYALIGRNEGNLVRAVHAADPLLVDLLVRRLAETAGVRFAD